MNIFWRCDSCMGLGMIPKEFYLCICPDFLTLGVFLAIVGAAILWYILSLKEKST